MALEHVVWIGGGTGSGKTTLTRGLACRHGLRAYHVDAFWYDHDARLAEPVLAPDEQWLAQTPAEQAAAFEARARRGFELVVEDIAALPQEPAVVVEGPQVLPDVLPRGAPAVFLIPTAAFQRSLLEQRPMPPTADPPAALENRIEKDRLYAEQVASLAAAHGFETIVVDGSCPPADILAGVETSFAAFLAAHETAAELAPVRRWQNEVTAANVRSWLASSQAPAEAPPGFSFACECGRRGCAARVTLALAEYDSLPHVVAAAHAVQTSTDSSRSTSARSV